jgi:hypothetical protein
MPYTTGELVRREVGKLLRVDYEGKFLCSSCLAKLVRAWFGTAYPKSQIERAMNEVFASPGALTRMPTFICAKCRTLMPCLGAPL